MLRGLRSKILVLTLLPILLFSAVISVVAINNKVEAERQSLIDRLNIYRSLLESGNLSFDTVQNKERLKGFIGEEVVLAEILRSDYSVIYNSENSAAPLISENEKSQVDAAFTGIETVSTENIEGKSVLTVITPLIIDGQIVAVMHERLSNVQSLDREMRYAAFIIAVVLLGLISCLVLIYTLLARVVVRGIYTLKQATVEIQAGHLDKRIEIRSRDEIGDLAQSFNAMTEDLQASQKNIEKQVKELSEEHGKLSSLVESIKLGVVMVDLRLNVILSNGAARQIFGKPEDKELSFQDISDVTRDKMNISQALSYYVKSGKQLNIQETLIGERYFRFFMSPVRDIVDKMFIGAVVVIEDITDQKKIDQMRTEIVSITSHQLRTPATIVKGNLEMALGGDAGALSSQQKELIEDAHMGNERMIRLINDLMDAAKISEGKVFLPVEIVSIEDVAKELVDENQIFAKEKRVKLSYVPPAAAIPKVKSNRQKVKQVLQNLVDNAIKYSAIEDKGQVVVEVKDTDGFIEFSVKDNGIGIPLIDQGKIFQRFSRGSNSSKMDPGGGSGLGLYIAKAVIEQGGGKIWFETAEGKGTTFHATFPKN
jgi:signal transduction histidine kinase